MTGQDCRVPDGCAKVDIDRSSARIAGNKPFPDKDRERHHSAMTGFMKFPEKGVLEQFEAGIPVL
jgi:hypothetical protein